MGGSVWGLKVKNREIALFFFVSGWFMCGCITGAS